MSPPRASSPFPTSHDTLGASSLNTPHFLASSPPGIANSFQPRDSYSRRRSSDRATTSNAGQKDKPSGHARATSPSDGSDSEVDLSDYTFDLDKLPGQAAGVGSIKGDAPSRSAEQQGDNETNDGPAAELGGPHDFTLNMVELVRGGTTKDQQDTDNKPASNQKEAERGHTMIPDEYSEFEPPLDMSTPAHVMSHHKSVNRDDSMLKSADRMRPFREGSSRVSPVAEEPDNEDDDIRAELEQLRKELRQKDEIIQTNQRRVLDAASVAQQARHLQSELHRQALLLKEKEDCQNENTAQQEQIKRLQVQLEVKSEQLHKNETELDELKCLREEDAEQVRKGTNEPREGQEKTGTSRGDLSFVRHQLEEKDKALEQTSSKFQETMTAHETKLQEKITEIEQLKTLQDEQCLELDRLDSDLESVIRERDALLSRTGELEEVVQQQQQRLDSLNSELTTAKAERTSDMNALRMLASELSIDAEDQQLPEIVASLKSVCKGSLKSTSSEEVGTASQKPRQVNEAESSDLRLQLQESTSLTRILTQQLESTREELEESKSLYSTIQKDNSQLKSQLEEVTTSRSTIQSRLDEVTNERDEAVHTLHELRAQVESPQKSKFPSPPAQMKSSASKVQESPDAVHCMHRTELDKIQAAHTTTLSAIRDSHAEATRNFNSLLSSTQQRETELLSELTALRKASSTQETELATLKYERDNLESVVEAKNATAAAMDTKFASVLRKREEVWEARMERLLGDRERMGKVLMWTWGEMETGDAQKREGAGSRRGKVTGKSERSQRYRYKHVQKETDGK